MKFFTNQKQDEAGVVGISLQKIIIFFMVIDSIFFCLGGNLGSFLSFIYHAIVLMGVYRRRTCVLMLYVIFNVMIFAMTAFVIILAIVMITMTSSQIDTSSDQYTPSGNSQSTHYNTVSSMVRRTWFTNSTASDASSSMESPSQVDADAQTIYIALLIVILASSVLVYFKVLSTVLAHRMRKILLSANNGLPVYTAVPTEPASDEKPHHEEDPAFDAAQQYPGFIPYHPSMQQQGFYPNIQGAPHAMMPPPFMYGQHPVFYTFAPPPPQPNNEKQI